MKNPVVLAPALMMMLADRGQQARRCKGGLCMHRGVNAARAVFRVYLFLHQPREKQKIHQGCARMRVNTNRL